MVFLRDQSRHPPDRSPYEHDYRPKVFHPQQKHRGLLLGLLTPLYLLEKIGFERRIGGRVVIGRVLRRVVSDGLHVSLNSYCAPE